MREVRSSWSGERDDLHPRLAVSPGSRSSPSNVRAYGHIAGQLANRGLSKHRQTPVLLRFLRSSSARTAGRPTRASDAWQP